MQDLGPSWWFVYNGPQSFPYLQVSHETLVSISVVDCKEDDGYEEDVVQCPDVVLDTLRVYYVPVSSVRFRFKMFSGCMPASSSPTRLTVLDPVRLPSKYCPT